MPKINSTSIIYTKCISCTTEIEIKVYSNPQHPNFGSPIIGYKNKISCSKECHRLWQLSISWDKRIGEARAEQIRKEKSDFLKTNNPSKKPEVAEKISKSLKKYISENPGVRSGKNNSFYGKTHSEDQKEKWRESKKGKWSYNH